MYKQAFYITLAAPKDSGEKYIFKKVSGWGERFPYAVHTFAGLPSFDGGCFSIIAQTRQEINTIGRITK